MEDNSFLKDLIDLNDALEFYNNLLKSPCKTNAEKQGKRIKLNFLRSKVGVKKKKIYNRIFGSIVRIKYTVNGIEREALLTNITEEEGKAFIKTLFEYHDSNIKVKILESCTIKSHV